MPKGPSSNKYASPVLKQLKGKAGVDAWDNYVKNTDKKEKKKLAEKIAAKGNHLVYVKASKPVFDYEGMKVPSMNFTDLELQAMANMMGIGVHNVKGKLDQILKSYGPIETQAEYPEKPSLWEQTTFIGDLAAAVKKGLLPEEPGAYYVKMGKPPESVMFSLNIIGTMPYPVWRLAVAAVSVKDPMPNQFVQYLLTCFANAHHVQDIFGNLGYVKVDGSYYHKDNLKISFDAETAKEAFIAKIIDTTKLIIEGQSFDKPSEPVTIPVTAPIKKAHGGAMKLSLNPLTVAYQASMRPGVRFRDMSSVPLASVVKSLNDYMGMTSIDKLVPDAELPAAVQEPAMGHPELDALVFYMLNHAVSILRQRLHPYQNVGKYAPIFNMYHENLAVRSARMFFYMLLICTRESRHDHRDQHGSSYKAQAAKYPAAVTNFHLSIKGKTSSTTSAEALRDKPPEASVGSYTSFLAETFYEGNYSGGYGGPAWGKVADVLRDFVYGKLTAEMMMDTAFTLCHNNGPIFNKGMLFNSYSSDIYKILDVQRAGMIPQLIATSGVSQADNSRLTKLYAKCRDLIGDDFTGSVDWYKVEALGSMKKYPTEKSAQDQKNKMSTGVKPGPSLDEIFVKKSVKLDDPIPHLEVMPNLFAIKTKKVRK